MFKEIKNIVKDSQVCDACSEDEREALLWYLRKIISDPTKDWGRLYCDKTFAIRLWTYLDRLLPKPPKKIMEFAKELFNLQLSTATEDEEISYLKNISRIREDGERIYL